MRPFTIIFAIAITGAYSIDTYNYPPPSQPLELGSSSHPSISNLPLSQSYNYRAPARNFDSSSFGSNSVDDSSLGGARYQLPLPGLHSSSKNGDSSAFSSSPVGDSSLGGYKYQSPSRNIDSSSFGSSPGGYRDQSLSRNIDSSSFGSSPIGDSSLGGYKYQSPSRNIDSSSFGSSPGGYRDQSPSRNFDNSPFGGGNNYQSNSGPSDLSSLGNSQHQNINNFPSTSYGFPSEAEQVQKNVYIYVAPSDPAQSETKQIIVPSPAVSHKIIFIKTPEQVQARSRVVHLPSKSEEKTLVYVLVKKPEEQQIDVQPVRPKVASKPEVYFIKYNTKKENDGQGDPSGSHPSVLPPGNQLPVVEDSFRGRDPSTSQSREQPTPVYGPSH